MSAFLLDDRIAAATVGITGLWLSDLRLMNDARFPWVVLVPRVAGAEEIIDLPKADRSALCDEITAVSQAMLAATGSDKLNVASLGNIVRQLHVHIVGRSPGDAAWPGPVWGNGTAVGYRPEDRDRLVAKVLAALPS
jgi:diadenosine tetraphosphate (Ap4A) HIT family hydrolase